MPQASTPAARDRGRSQAAHDGRGWPGSDDERALGIGSYAELRDGTGTVLAHLPNDTTERVTIDPRRDQRARQAVHDRLVHRLRRLARSGQRRQPLPGPHGGRRNAARRCRRLAARSHRDRDDRCRDHPRAGDGRCVVDPAARPAAARDDGRLAAGEISARRHVVASDAGRRHATRSANSAWR